MTMTLATEKQAEAIKQRMAQIRSELPYGVDEARNRVRELADWKYHMSRHPLPILAAAAVVGYLVVPKKQTYERIVIHRDPAGVGQSAVATKPVKRGLLGGIVGAVATTVLRQATSVAATHVSNLLSNRETS